MTSVGTIGGQVGGTGREKGTVVMGGGGGGVMGRIGGGR